MADRKDGDDDGYKVGPGNPPREHSWRKGCPSPNPSGRPTKEAQRKKMMKKLEPFEEMVVRTAGLSGDDGISLQERAYRQAYKLAFDPEKPNVKALALVMEYTRHASQAMETLKHEAVVAAYKYKQETRVWMREMEIKGVKCKPPIPHPDDIHITPDNEIVTLGPVTEAGQLAMEARLAQREQIEKMLPLFMENEDRELRARNLRSFKRLWQKRDKQLPPRLRKPWPLSSSQMALDAPENGAT